MFVIGGERSRLLRRMIHHKQFPAGLAIMFWGRALSHPSVLHARPLFSGDPEMTWSHKEKDLHNFDPRAAQEQAEEMGLTMCPTCDRYVDETVKCRQCGHVGCEKCLWRDPMYSDFWCAFDDCFVNFLHTQFDALEKKVQCLDRVVAEVEIAQALLKRCDGSLIVKCVQRGLDVALQDYKTVQE